MKSDRLRTVAAGICGMLGVIALVLGVLLGYATRSLFNSEAFSARVAASLSEPGVSAFVAGKIADGVIIAKPDLVGLRPMILAGSRTVVVSAPFRAAARRAAREAHRALLSGTGEKVLLSIPDVGEILNATLTMQPELAAKLPRRLSATLARLEDVPAAEVAARLARAVRRARLGSVTLLTVGLALVGASAGLARDRRRALFRTGLALATAAALLWFLARFGGFVAATLPHDPAIGQLVLGLWGGFATGLTKWALSLGLVGLVVASASSSTSKRGYLADGAAATWRWIVTPPPGHLRQFLRGLGGLILGICALAWPLGTLGVLALLGGGFFAYLGFRECFAAALHALPEMERRSTSAAGSPDRGTGWIAARVAMLGGLSIAIIAVAVVLLLRTPSEQPLAPTEITACNGYPELCDRRLDQVVFPATHNAMSAADISNWMFPSQNKSIPKQLEDGVRGFLIDAHYGMPVGEQIKTMMENEQTAVAKYEAAVGKEGVEAAMRIRDRLVGGDERQRGVYMAHGFCELGATPLVETLGQMRDFLVANPGEILIIIIQDEGVAPQDIEKCFEGSGLIDFVYRGPVTPPWPTLREMAESDQRVVVLAENNSAGVPWYHQTLGVLQETPYTFHDPTQFSNRPNRGGRRGSLLLMNHWIESTPMPKPSNAAIVNAYDFLLKRARACKRERRKLPNLIAVDFYSAGDLIRVTQTMNGIKP
jgi:hypothetical protein